MSNTTSRKKRSIERERAGFRDASLFFISTEGKETEKQYFESDIFLHRAGIHIEVISTPDDNTSAPEYVLDRLKLRIREYSSQKNLEAGDQFWLVIDKDRWPDKNLKMVAGKKK